MYILLKWKLQKENICFNKILSVTLKEGQIFKRCRFLVQCTCTYCIENLEEDQESKKTRTCPFPSYRNNWFGECIILYWLYTLWDLLSMLLVEPEVHTNPLQLAVSMCSPQKLVFGTVCLLLSGVTSLLCTGILQGRYQDLTVCTNR